jgi:hypothetical protein
MLTSLYVTADPETSGRGRLLTSGLTTNSAHNAASEARKLREFKKSRSRRALCAQRFNVKF